MVRLNADQRTDSRNSRQVLCNKKPAIWPAFFCPAEALLYRLPKVISEMVGQTCRFAATTRRSSPTFRKFILAIALCPGVSQLAQIFAPGGGTGVPPVCFWSATAPTFAAIHGRDPCHYFLVAASPLSPFVVSKPSLHRAGFSRFIEN